MAKDTLTPEQELENLKKEHAALQTAHNELQAAHDTMQKENVALGKEAKAKDKLIEKLQKNVTDAPAAPAPQKAASGKPVLPADTFDEEGGTYRFALAKFKFNGQEMTAVDALAMPDVLKVLVQKKSGAIVKVS